MHRRHMSPWPPPSIYVSTHCEILLSRICHSNYIFANVDRGGVKSNGNCSTIPTLLSIFLEGEYSSSLFFPFPLLFFFLWQWEYYALLSVLNGCFHVGLFETRRQVEEGRSPFCSRDKFGFTLDRCCLFYPFPRTLDRISRLIIAGVIVW